MGVSLSLPAMLDELMQDGVQPDCACKRKAQRQETRNELSREALH